MAKDTMKKFAIGTILAGVAGYLTGILTAPKSGKETRQDIKDTAHTTVANAEKQLKLLHTQMDQLLKEAKTRTSSMKGTTKTQLNDAINKTAKAKEKVRVLLSAAHESDVEDSDLQKAIGEADKAIKHLRTFLTK